MIGFRLTRNIESTSTIKPPTLAFSIVANAAGNSPGPLAPTETISRLSGLRRLLRPPSRRKDDRHWPDSRERRPARGWERFRAAVADASRSLPGANSVSPVTLPPGRRMLSTRPILAGSPELVAKTIGTSFVSLEAATAAATTEARIRSTFRLSNSCAREREQFVFLVDESVLEDEIAPLDIAKLAHALRERAEHDRFLFEIGGMPQYADLPDPLVIQRHWPDDAGELEAMASATNPKKRLRIAPPHLPGLSASLAIPSRPASRKPSRAWRPWRRRRGPGRRRQGHPAGR